MLCPYCEERDTALPYMCRQCWSAMPLGQKKAYYRAVKRGAKR